MPNTSYIRYKGKGFWIPEFFLEITCQYICKAFEQVGLSSVSPTLQAIYRQCNSNRIAASYSMGNISMDALEGNTADISSFISILVQAKALVLSIGTEISVSTLNQFEATKIDDDFKDIWTLPIKTQSIAATIDIIIQMLQETWNSSNYSVYYTGFPNPRNMPEI